MSASVQGLPLRAAAVRPVCSQASIIGAVAAPARFYGCVDQSICGAETGDCPFNLGSHVWAAAFVAGRRRLWTDTTAAAAPPFTGR